MVISTIALFSQICTHNILNLLQTSLTHTQFLVHTHTQSDENSTWLLQIHVRLSHCCFRGWMILASIPDRVWSWLSIGITTIFIFKIFSSHSDLSYIPCVYEWSSGGRNITQRACILRIIQLFKKAFKCLYWDMFYDIVPFIPSWGWALFFIFSKILFEKLINEIIYMYSTLFSV